jgi:TRAP-type mannitol/chloroaromatic compound transport system permease small subunit
MGALLAISRAIDRANALIGRLVMWLILAATLVSAGNAISRKAFDLSSNAFLELQWYLFGAAYLFAAAYTLQRNEHIRIDIVSNHLPKAARHAIELFGHVFMLLPFCVLMVWETWPNMMESYRIGEGSSNFGGLIVWPAKACIVAGFALLFLQGISELIKRIAVIAGAIPEFLETQQAPLQVEKQG